MNENLQQIISNLNSSETVSLADFIYALEQEPNIDISGIFNGTEISGSSIDWKNTVTDGANPAELIFYKIDNTTEWLFTLNNFVLSRVSDFLCKQPLITSAPCHQNKWQTGLELHPSSLSA